MKFFLFLSAALLFASPLLAQSPEPPPASELSKLRQVYVESLNRLLQQYVKTNDVAAAAVVSQEIDKMAGAVPAVPPITSPCGAWRWPGGDVITITADGITTHPEWKTKGIWHWTNESQHQFQIEWQDGFVDKMTVSPDGTTLHGVNNQDRKFTTDRLPLPEKAVANPSMN